jgi:hypothetical protein
MTSTETARPYAVGDRVDVLPFAEGCPLCQTKVASTLGTVVEYTEEFAEGGSFIVAMDIAKGAPYRTASDGTGHVCGARVVCRADFLRPAPAEPTRTIWSRDGQWAYHVLSCGWCAAVTHLPTTRTLHIDSTMSRVRRLVASGQLLEMVHAADE